MNGDYFNPSITGGAEGIVKRYKHNLPYLKLHGPTIFSEIIKMGRAYAQQEDDSQQKYYILLILTDGQINDVEATVQEIVEASDQPISIIIAGIGENNFDKIKQE